MFSLVLCKISRHLSLNSRQRDRDRQTDSRQEETDRQTVTRDISIYFPFFFLFFADEQSDKILPTHNNYVRGLGTQVCTMD